MSPADQVLFDQWITRRDANAFTRLAEKYAAMVYAVGRRITGNAHDAEDVAQAAFEALASERRAPKVHLGAWLHRVATYRALNHLNAENRRAEREARYERERPKHTEIGWDDIYELVDEAIAALPDKQRDVVVAHYLEGKTHDAIARELGVSRPAVTQRVQAGVAGIRAVLGKRGVTLTLAALGGLLANGAEAAAPAALAAQLGKIALSGYTGKTGTGIGLWQALIEGLGTAKGLAALALVCGSISIPAVYWVQRDMVGGPIEAPSIAAVSSSPVAPARAATATNQIANVEAAIPATMAAAAVPSTASAAVAETTTPAVSGIVVDRNDVPIAGASVYARDIPVESTESVSSDKTSYGYSVSAGIRKSTTTAEDGSFTLERIPEGTLIWDAYPPGWMEFESGIGGPPVEISLGRTEHRTDVRLVITADLTISGRVTTVDGTPVEGATLRAYRITGRRVGGYSSCVSDKQGRYEIPLLPEGDLDIEASSPDYSEVTLKEVPAGSRDVVIVMEGRGAVEGTVVNGDTGEPISVFYASDKSRAGTTGVVPGFKNLGGGKFQLEKVDAAMSSVTIAAPGFDPTTVPLPSIVPGEVISGMLVEMTPVYVARGTVLDRAGNPVYAAKIFTNRVLDSAFDVAHHNALTNQYGEFELHGVVPETPDIVAFHKDLGTATARLDWERSEPVTLVLEPGGSVEGTVLLGGQPAANASVHATSSLGTRHHSDLDKAGHYRIDGLAPGRAELSFRIFGSDPSRPRARSVEAVIVENQTTPVNMNFALATSTLEGWVSDRSGPLARATIHATIARDGEEDWFSTESNEEGYYVFDALPSGVVALTLMTPTGVRKQEDVQLPEGTQLRHDFQLDAGTVVTCTFGKFSNGAAHFQVGVFAGQPAPVPRNKEERKVFNREAIGMATSYGGRPITLPGLSPGTYAIVAYEIPENYPREELDTPLASVPSVAQSITVSGESDLAVDFNF